MSARIDQRPAGNYNQITRTTPDPPWSFLFSTQLNFLPHHNEWSVFEKCFSILTCIVKITCRHVCAFFQPSCAIFCQWTCKSCKIVYFTLFWGKIHFLQLWWHEHSPRLQISRIFRFWIKIIHKLFYSLIQCPVDIVHIHSVVCLTKVCQLDKNIVSILNQNTGCFFNWPPPWIC